MIINPFSDEESPDNYTPIGHDIASQLQGTPKNPTKGSVGKREFGGLVHRAI
jgi:hypothetical protein